MVSMSAEVIEAYLKAGNQWWGFTVGPNEGVVMPFDAIFGERVAKEIRQDAEWWAKHRHLSDAKFAHAVGAIPDKVKIKYPEIPGPKLGKEAADAVTEEDLLRMDTGYISTMQSDFFWAQSSGVWDWYKESGAMTTSAAPDTRLKSPE